MEIITLGAQLFAKKITQHQMGEGENFTRKQLPGELVYFEKFQRIA